MRKHLILGAGNLGLDLKLQAEKRGDLALVASRSSGWDYTKQGLDPIRIQLAWATDIWCTIGAGSIEGAERDFRDYADLHIKLPMELVQNAPHEVRIHLFTTNYIRASETKRTLYARSKKYMEKLVLSTNRPNVSIYEVQSLYGTHKPWSCFPGKVIKSYLDKKEPISVPSNECVPTPTDWLAESILMLDPIGFVPRCWPDGYVSQLVWASTLVPTNKELFIDYRRPIEQEGQMVISNKNGCKTLWADRAQFWKGLLNAET